MRWTKEDNNFAQEVLDGTAFAITPNEISVIITGVEITKDKAIDIVGAENIKRYWNEGIPDAAVFILENGSNQWGQIYKELEDSGWNARSVSVLKELVDHYRNFNIEAAADEIASEPVPIEVFKRQKDCFYTGRIGCLTDKSGEPIALTITCPYDEDLLFIIRRITGKTWTGKLWKFPLERASQIFTVFSEFELSPKASALKAKINA